jgi:hypothetical protein
VSEHHLWDRLRDGMATRWHAQRHEDKHSKGIPDVSYGIGRRGDGWIELKYLKQYPRDDHEAAWDLKLDHFTVEQRNWLSQRAKHGTGRVFVMCQFGNTMTGIWQWNKLAPLLGKKSLYEIEKAASGIWWHGPINFAELTLILGENRVIPCRYRGP